MSILSKLNEFSKVDAEPVQPGVGPTTYSERRLLDIAQAADSIAFWVRLWSALSIAAFVIMLFVMANG